MGRRRNPDFGAADDLATLEVARDALREKDTVVAAALLKHVTPTTLANMLIERVALFVNQPGETVFGFDHAQTPRTRRGPAFWNYVWITPNMAPRALTEIVTELREIDDPLFVDVEWSVGMDGDRNGEFRQFIRFFPMGALPDRSWPHDYPWWDYEGPEVRGERMKIGKIKNPSTAPNEDRAKAIDKYEEFTRLSPKKVGDFPASFKIPARVRRVGAAKSVMYRSDKIDPATGRDPGKGIDYIHEHDSGVSLYVPGGSDGAADTDVPDFITSCKALVKLGTCLGFEFEYENGHADEAKATRPMPELYTLPSGKALIVIQDKKQILAMMWGGDLGVEGRGIVG